MLFIRGQGHCGSKELFLSKIEIIWGQLLALPQTLCLSVGKPHHFTRQLFIISKTGLTEDILSLSHLSWADDVNKSTKKRSGHVCTKGSVVSVEIPKPSPKCLMQVPGAASHTAQTTLRPTAKRAQVQANYRADKTVNHVIRRGLMTGSLLVC